MVKIKIFEPTDAEKLAVLLNESEEGWPGGLTGGIQFDARRTLEWVEKENAIAPLIAVEDEKAVGMCFVTEHFRDKEAVYLEFLNVHPDYRGRGIGRNLILRAIEEALKRGYLRVDLHTWGGNLRAVPLYKKTGFFWVPKTNVYMQNFIPMILSHPMTGVLMKKMNLRHLNWYGKLRRELDIKEDDYKLEGIKVFPYTFTADGKRLKILIDREARGICGFENEDLSVITGVEHQDAIAGMEQKYFVKIKNESSEKIKFKLLLHPDRDVQLKKDEILSVEVKPKEQKTIEIPLKPSELAERRDEDEKAWIIRCDFISNGAVFPLVSGLRIKQAVEVQTHPYPITLNKGFKGKFILNIRSNMSKTAKLRMKIIHNYSWVNIPVKQVKIEPYGFTGIEGEAWVKREIDPGVYPFTVIPEIDCEGQKIRCKPLKFNFRVLDSSNYLIGFERDENTLVVENASNILTLNLRRGGSLKLIDRDLDEMVLETLKATIGPPYWPSEFENKRFTVKIEQEEHGLKLTLRAKSSKYPGITLLKEVELPAGSPLIRVRYGLLNENEKEFKVKIKAINRLNTWGKIYNVPLKGRVVRSPAIEGDFPYYEADLPKDPKEYNEKWLCIENPASMNQVSILWDKVVENEFDIANVNLYYSLTAKPLSISWAKPFYILTGRGSWETARRYWHEIYRGDLRKIRPLPAKSYVEIESQNILKDGNSTVSVTIRNNRRKTYNGEVIITPPKELKIEREKFNFKNLTFGEQKTIKTKIIGSVKPGAYRGKVKLILPERVIEKDLPIIICGDIGEVKVRRSVVDDMEVFTVENGYLTFKVSPSFGGSLFSLKCKDVELLKSSYPKIISYLWWAKWTGGIMLADGKWRLTFHKEKWVGEEIASKDWKGVKVWFIPRNEENRDLNQLKIGMKCITIPHSMLIALIPYIENQSGAFRDISLNLAFFLNLKREKGEYRMILPFKDETYVRRENPYSAWTPTHKNYAIAFNTAMKHYITLISTSRYAKIGIMDESQQYGGGLFSQLKVRLKPFETKDYPILLAISENLEEAKTYSVLANTTWDNIVKG